MSNKTKTYLAQSTEYLTLQIAAHAKDYRRALVGMMTATQATAVQTHASISIAAIRAELAKRAR